MPIAGKKVADELNTVCDNEKCKNIINYFDALYLFKKEYELIKETKK